jgi:NAD+ synthase
VGVLLPCHGDPQDERDAVEVATHFSLRAARIDLSNAHDALLAAAEPAVPEALPRGGAASSVDPLRGRVPAANIKPRLRMTALYYLANRLNYLVAGTGNRSELAIGYFTKWGDGGVDLLPLGRLFKSQVLALARELGVPKAARDRPPSAGLWPGQRDEEEMGFTYAELERYLAEGPQSVAPALAMKIERLVRSSEHKRELPAMPEFV